MEPNGSAKLVKDAGAGIYILGRGGEGYKDNYIRTFVLVDHYGI